MCQGSPSNMQKNTITKSRKAKFFKKVFQFKSKEEASFLKWTQETFIQDELDEVKIR